MNPMKFKYKNEILLFFIVVFGFIILYYGLGKICNKRPIIEGITSSDNNKSSTKPSDTDKKNTTNKGDSLEVKEIKQKLKIMDNDITNKLQPKVNKILEKIQNVSKEIYGGIKKKTDEKLNSFADKNNESTAILPQTKVPPFSASEINNSI